MRPVKIDRSFEKAVNSLELKELSVIPRSETTRDFLYPSSWMRLDPDRIPYLLRQLLEPYP